MFTACFILLTRETEDLYIVAFNKVKELLHNFFYQFMISFAG